MPTSVNSRGSSTSSRTSQGGAFQQVGNQQGGVYQQVGNQDDRSGGALQHIPLSNQEHAQSNGQFEGVPVSSFSRGSSSSTGQQSTGTTGQGSSGNTGRGSSGSSGQRISTDSTRQNEGHTQLGIAEVSLGTVHHNVSLKLSLLQKKVFHPSNYHI